MDKRKLKPEIELTMKADGRWCGKLTVSGWCGKLTVSGHIPDWFYMAVNVYDKASAYEALLELRNYADFAARNLEGAEVAAGFTKAREGLSVPSPSGPGETFWEGAVRR